ncbi:MAG: asparagine synthase (glutamine-hydrolyzing) [Opitutales bacterium]|nr:asparagine synthase (glutamine-hydrolyzing) [Opitutales bacterium]MCH8540802.1 asparagine synthase (glutamine-hydrolyzing) [Opitutales bacterium]
MCGITGFWKPKQLPDQAEADLKKMVDAIHHRGPDGQGFHLDDKSGVGMGHSRLTIIDLVTGHQPLCGIGQDIVLCVNGEFYDYKRHRTELMTDGVRFRTRSDSEIALHYYERMGMEMMDHLRGEFAFALFDKPANRFILARDRFGIRPLFYTIHNGCLYYGSEVKALLANPNIPRRLDRRQAIHQMMQTTIPGHSAFENIKSVRPGHFLTFTPDQSGGFTVEEQCYWDIDFPTLSDRRDEGSPEEYIQLIRDKLIESVTFRLEADVPVGCYLSGGIDSCSILGMASGAQQSPVKAFTISFDHDSYDESGIAREMAQSMNAEQEVINLKADDLYGQNYLRTMWFAERTFYNTLGVAKYCMSRRVRECGYKSVITGEGADELFGGYPSFKRDMFLHGIKDEPEEVVKSYHEALEKTNRIFKGAILAEDMRDHPAFNELCGFTPSWIQPWMATLDIARPLLSKEAREETADYDPIGAIAESFNPRRIQGRHPLDISQYTWSRTMLEGQILNWGGDRVDMANSMESRPAFLDHYVAEAAFKVPPKYRIKGNIEKWVLREAMKGILPEVLYKREKFAFMAPPGHTEKNKKTALSELLDTYLSPEKVAEAGVLDPTAVSRFLHEYEKDTDPVSLTRKDALINHLLGLQILHDQCIAGNKPDLDPVEAGSL